MKPARRQQGQALTEFAFALPLFAIFVLGVIQLSLVFITFYSETRMARETARWLAIHRKATDTEVTQHVRDTMLPGLVGAPAANPVFDAARQEITYDVRRMKVTLSCNPNAAPCSTSSRAPATPISVQMRYDMCNLLFLLPQACSGTSDGSFRMSYLSTKFPTSLPPYRVYVMAE